MKDIKSVVWNDIEWECIRESPVDWKVIEDEKNHSQILSLFGIEGSIWGTREFRIQQFHVDEPSVRNIFLTSTSSINAEVPFSSFSVEVKFIPLKHGSQAGIVYYIDDMNYVKLVLEGDKLGRTMVILAVQHHGEPEVIYKLADLVNDGKTFIPLSLTVSSTPSSSSSSSNEGMKLHISGNNFNEIIFTPKVIVNGRFGVMAHSFESAIDEVDRWAHFINPILK
jgi:hypothetical protein